MKGDVASYVSKCLTCQQVKIEHQKPGGMLQPLTILEWKWDRVTMDLVLGLPRTLQNHDSIWVIVDRLAKTSHFIPISSRYKVAKLCKLYIDFIVRLHGVPTTIVTDRDARFNIPILERIAKCLGN